MIKVKCKKNIVSKSFSLELTFDFIIEENEVISVFGKSGTGKTTFLRILAGLTQPSEGYIEVKNEVWFDSEKKINIPSQKRNVGYVFQEFSLFPNMTIKENLLFAFVKEKDIKFMNRLIDIAEVSPFLNRYPESISGGQKQRVAIIRALIRKPSLLLLDEPFSALDREMRINLQDLLIRVFNEYKIPAFFVTHDASEVLKISKKVLVLESGNVSILKSTNHLFKQNILSGKHFALGEVVDIHQSDIFWVVSLLSGNRITKVTLSKEEALLLKISDQVIISSKAFSPILVKI